MPLYEYHCEECGERFEEYRPVQRRNGARCPRCHRPAHRLISRVHVASIVASHYAQAERRGACVIGDEDARAWGLEDNEFAPEKRQQQLVEQSRRLGRRHRPVKELAHQIRMGSVDHGPVG